jgi:hypothetical protein
MPDIVIKEMTIKDYNAAMELWQHTENLGLSTADRLQNIAILLLRAAFNNR